MDRLAKSHPFLSYQVYTGSEIRVESDPEGELSFHNNQAYKVVKKQIPVPEEAFSKRSKLISFLTS